MYFLYFKAFKIFDNCKHIFCTLLYLKYFLAYLWNFFFDFHIFERICTILKLYFSNVFVNTFETYFNKVLTVYIIIVTIIIFSSLFLLLFKHNFWCFLFSFFFYYFSPSCNYFWPFSRGGKNQTKTHLCFLSEFTPKYSHFPTCCLFPPHLLPQKIPFLAPFFAFLIQLQISPHPSILSPLFFHRLGIILRVFFVLFFSPR